MPRKFKTIGNEWVEFVPEFEGNKDLEPGEQISCKIRLLSQADNDKLMDFMISEQRAGKKNIKLSNSTFEVVNSHVKEIKNLIAVKSGVEQKIENMAQLYEVPELKGLYTEIANALDASGKLTELEIKN